jgi:excinuclease UvrABC nuclease subunit
MNDFNTIINNNLKELLIIEQNLIKEHEPCFNVLLKDSPHFSYLEITSRIPSFYKVVQRINLSIFNKLS